MTLLMLVSRWARRVRYLLRRSAAEREMDEEMRLHLELEMEDQVRRGLPPDEARRAAAAAFGQVERHREDARHARGVQPIEDLGQDLAYAVRVLRKSPGFALVSILTLAIGIGGTTAVFSGVSAFVLRPPPVHDPGRLFILSEVWTSGQRSVTTGMANPMYPFDHYLDVREATGGVFTRLAGYRYGTVSLRIGTEARPIGSAAVSSNYFEVLAIRPALGRLLSGPPERSMPQPEVVISHDLWTGEFLRDSSVIGRTLYVDSRPMTVTGVAPPGFVGTMAGLAVDLWLPTTSGPVTMLGRLRGGLTAQQAVAALSAIGPRIRTDDSWRQIARMTLDPMTGPPAQARGAVIGFIGILLLAAGLVLLIAAANVAGMSLARAAHRRREIAVRVALGAGRGRVVRQLATESLLLCVIGGAAGVLAAAWLLRLVPVLDLPIGVRTALDLRLDPRVLAVAAAVSLCAALIAGLTPALWSTRIDLVSGLRGLELKRPRWLMRSRGAFVTAQLAMSLVLLLTAGLFARALQRAARVDPGLDAQNVVVTEINLGTHGYDAVRGRAFYSRLKSRLASRPDVGAVALAHWAPLSVSHNSEGITLPDRGYVPVTWGVADEAYLGTLGIPLVAGRPFREAEAVKAPVVIVNQTLAKRLWPGDSPVGRQLRLVGATREVVGVVRDGKYHSLDEPPTAFAFIPFSQRYSDRMTVYVRARGDEATGLAALREEVARLDPNIALENAGSFGQQLEIYSLPQRLAAWSLGVFGLLGLGLAAMGVYGVIAYHVAQQTRDVGIRLALGARGRDVMRAVLMPALVIVAVAIPIALPLALAIARVASPFLYGVGVIDPVSLIGASLLFAGVAIVASYVPARRAAVVDPMASLRTD